MDKTELRRERLRQWFENRTLPPEEKSYLSQLMKGKAPFGEKAARRLEKELGMGELYLDRPSSEEQEDINAFLRGPGAGFINGDELLELITLYKEANTEGRKFIMQSARVAKKSASSRTAAANDHS